MLCEPEPKILNDTILWKALRIYCGSAAGPLILAGPLHVYIYCFFADLLRICCGPVDCCGPTVYIYCFIADLQLRICCGPVDSCGPTVYIVFRCGSAAAPLILSGPLFIYSVSLRIYCGSAVSPLILAGPLFMYTVSLRIYCGSAAGPQESYGPTVYIVFRCRSAADLLRAR